MKSPEIELRMKALINRLNGSAEAYYSGRREPSMSDYQYDQLLTELMNLEEESGIHFANSPVGKVGFEETEDGKFKHTKPILSLKSTKSVEEMVDFLKKEDIKNGKTAKGILSWKLDGVSIVLYYFGGKLKQALSRGNGHIGKDITANVRQMNNVPTTISIKNTVIVRGEGCMSIANFDQIKLTKEGERYKNPRNLAAGLINATKTSSILLRQLSFIAHTAIFIGEKKMITREDQLLFLDRCGFEIVPYYEVLCDFDVADRIQGLTELVSQFRYPVDGLVLTINDIQHGESLGATEKHPKHSLAYKWSDKTATTKVIGMKWSVSKTGLITPVVLLEPVFLEGTEVKQANLHSLKIFEQLAIGKGDVVKVYKANKIVPEIEENYDRTATEPIPDRCPQCGSSVSIVPTDQTKKLVCNKDFQICE